MDARLLRMLVFLFEVEQMYEPPHHALYDDTVDEGPRSTDWLWEARPAVIGLGPWTERLLLGQDAEFAP